MGRLSVLLAIAAVAVLSALYLGRGDLPGRAPPRSTEEAAPPVPTRTVEGAPAAEEAADRAVFGRVVRASDGTPVAGAAVELIPHWAEGSTDDEGRFEIPTRSGGLVRCAVKAAGLRAALGPWLRFGEAARLDAGTIRLEPGSRIAGRVVGADGRGVAGAWVDVEREGELSEEWEAILGQFGTADADGEGRFVFEGLDDGLFRMSAAATDSLSGDDFRRTIEHVRPGGEEVLIVFPFSVNPVGGTIAVFVTLPDGRPLPHGDLVAGAGDSSTAGTIVDGKAKVEVEGVSPAWFVVLHPMDEEQTQLPYRPAFRMDVVPRDEPYAVILEPGETIEGIVVTTEGAPVADADVSLWRLGAEDGLARFVRVGLGAESGPDGLFRCVGLSPGEYGLRADCPGFAPVRPSTPARTGATDVRIEMRRAGRIRLRALAPEGDLLDGGSFTLVAPRSAGERTTNISVGGNSQHTCLDAEFDGLVEGQVYRIRGSVVRRGFGRYAPIDVDAVAGDGEPVEVRLRLGRTIRGRVVRDDGEPVPGGEVRVRVPRPVGTDEHAHHGADRGQAYVHSALDGRFELHGVPDGAFWLTCSAAGLAQKGGPLAVGPQEADVAMAMVPALEISGRVVGEGPLDFRVDWIPADWSGEALRVPREFEYAGADGFFALRDLPPGTMRLDGWRPWDEEDDRYLQADGVRAGAADLRLPVRKGVRIEGTLKDREGRPVAEAGVAVDAPWGARQATTDEEGRFVLRALPPGRHALHVAGLGAPVQADAPGPPVHLIR